MSKSSILKSTFLCVCLLAGTAAHSAELIKWYEDTDKIDIKVAKVKLKVSGNVEYGLAGYSENHIAINNVANLNVSGKHVIVTSFCKVTIGAKTEICMDALTGKISGGNGSGVECKIMGVDSEKLSLPVEANACMTIDMKGTVGGKPTGSFAIGFKGKIGGDKLEKTLVKMSM
jgi:hypothetical protein